MLTAFLTAQVLDGLLTYFGVRSMGPAAEGNPLIAWLMGHVGEGPALAGTKLLAGSFGIALHLSSVHRIIAVLTVFYFGVAILPWVKILFF